MIIKVDKTITDRKKINLNLPYCGTTKNYLKTQYVMIIPNDDEGRAEDIDIKIIKVVHYNINKDIELSISTHNSHSYYFNISEWETLGFDEWDNIIGDYKDKLEEL